MVGKRAHGRKISTNGELLQAIALAPLTRLGIVEI